MNWIKITDQATFEEGIYALKNERAKKKHRMYSVGTISPLGQVFLFIPNEDNIALKFIQQFTHCCKIAEEKEKGAA